MQAALEGPNAATLIDAAPMRARQWLAVIMTILLNALDGFDVLSSAFAGPGIKQEWHLAPDGLGAILSMELIGMGLGSLLFGGWADRAGRRPTILVCLVLMATGMFLAAGASSPVILSAWRVLTGLGIGGMLAATNALVHELSNDRRRSFAMAFMVIGYPLGAFFGGLLASALLRDHGWRVVFVLGGTMTLVCIPLVLLFVPETVAWLARAHPRNALARINHSLTRLGHDPVASLPPPPPERARGRLADLFGAEHRRVTLLISLAYAAHAMTFYFILKMAPAIMSDPQFAGQHFTRAQGAGVLAYANLGGAIGGGCFGWFMHRLGIRRSTMAGLGLSVLLVGGFGLGSAIPDGPSALLTWTVLVAVIALCTNAAIVGFYAAFAGLYPPELKATGTGLALTVGRGGAAAAPYLSGVLFAHHLGLGLVAPIMAFGSLVALALFAQLPDRRLGAKA